MRGSGWTWTALSLGQKAAEHWSFPSRKQKQQSPVAQLSGSRGAEGRSRRPFVGSPAHAASPSVTHPPPTTTPPPLNQLVGYDRRLSPWPVGQPGISIPPASRSAHARRDSCWCSPDPARGPRALPCRGTALAGRLAWCSHQPRDGAGTREAAANGRTCDTRYAARSTRPAATRSGRRISARCPVAPRRAQHVPLRHVCRAGRPPGPTRRPLLSPDLRPADARFSLCVFLPRVCLNLECHGHCHPAGATNRHFWPVELKEAARATAGRAAGLLCSGTSGGVVFCYCCLVPTDPLQSARAPFRAHPP
jgi:hypothetical protein